LLHPGNSYSSSFWAQLFDRRLNTLPVIADRRHNLIACQRDGDVVLAEDQLAHAAQVVADAERAKGAGLAELGKRYARLTPREREVLPFVVAGMLSKQTAGELCTSEITIRVHRGQIMGKMQAQSLADLIRMADNLGIQPTSCFPRTK
jgi:DNA-binding NarL/FixJ family response regulator